MKTSQTKEVSSAIATTYKGVQLKSRMEAQCAYLFDCLGWDWEYEPFSYMAGGVCYIPDFLIRCESAFLECRGYNSEKGARQIVEFANLVTSGEGINIDPESGPDFVDTYVVIGPDRVLTFSGRFKDEPPTRGQVVYGITVSFCESCKEWGLRYGPYCPKCIRTAFSKSGSITVKSGKILFNGLTSDQWGDSL